MDKEAALSDVQERFDAHLKDIQARRMKVLKREDEAYAARKLEELRSRLNLPQS